MSRIDHEYCIFQESISEHVEQVNFTEGHVKVEQEDNICQKAADITGSIMKSPTVNNIQDTCFRLDDMDIKVEFVDCGRDGDELESLCDLKTEIYDCDNFLVEGPCEDGSVPRNQEVENGQENEKLSSEPPIQENFFEVNFTCFQGEDGELYECRQCSFRTKDKVALDHHLLFWAQNVNHRLDFDATLDGHIVDNSNHMIKKVRNEHNSTEIEKHKCKDKTNLNEHVQDMHNDEIDTYSRIYHKIYGSCYSCKLCHIPTSDMRNLLEHMKSVHNNPLWLLQNNSVQHEVETTENQTVLDNESSGVDKVSSERYQYNPEVTSHSQRWRNIKPQTYPVQSNKLFRKQKASLKVRTKPNHKDNITSYEDAKCEMKKERRLKLRMKTHPKICFEQLILCVQDGVEESYQCTVCKYITKSRDDFKRHIKCIYNDKTNSYECAECRHTTKRRGGLIDHIKCKHNDQAENYKCGQCEYMSKRKDHLMNHVRFKHGDITEMYECPECIYRTKWKYSLKSHMTTKHDDTSEMYECAKCEYKSKNKKYLKRHEKDMHNESTESYKCPDCEYVTKRKSDLKYHIKHKHDNEVGRYVCTECGFTGKWKKSWLWHMKYAHDENAKVYKCTECEYTSKRKYKLTEHNKYHHSDITEIYKCAECEYTTKRKKSFIEHLKYRHEENVKMYECTKCEFITKRSQCLTQHVKYMHDDTAKRFECAKCGFETKRKPGLMVHMKRMHDNDDDDEREREEEK